MGLIPRKVWILLGTLLQDKIHTDSRRVSWAGLDLCVGLLWSKGTLDGDARLNQGFLGANGVVCVGAGSLFLAQTWESPLDLFLRIARKGRPHPFAPAGRSLEEERL